MRVLVCIEKQLREVPMKRFVFLFGLALLGFLLAWPSDVNAACGHGRGILRGAACGVGRVVSAPFRAVAHRRAVRMERRGARATCTPVAAPPAKTMPKIK